MRRLTLALALLAVAAFAGPARADTLAAGGLTLSKVGDFHSPVYVTSPPDDPSRLLVVEQDGTVALVKDGVVAPQKFLDIRSRATASWIAAANRRAAASSSAGVTTRSSAGG